MIHAHRWALLVGIGLAVVPRGNAAGDQPTRFEFREPALAGYRVDTARSGPRLASTVGPAWLPATRENGTTNTVWLGDRVVLRAESAAALSAALASGPLRVDRVVSPNLVILQAADAWEAADASARFARLPGVQVSHPVRRRPAKLHGSYAPKPNDPLYSFQWHLENRNTNTGAALGFDLNARSAWSFTRGEGVVVGQGDDGVEVSHPDLSPNMTNKHHHNFVTGSSTGTPVSSSQVHGTSVAGLIASRGDNQRGVAGVAPRAQVASLVIFDSFDGLGSEEAVMDMFQYRSNVVAVQNHSWGNADVYQLALGALEDQGMSNAIAYGREGRGTIMARSAGNDRTALNDVNDDGYGQDPRAIAVGAVRNNGRAVSYSTPGAPVLVAAFSGDDDVSRPDGTSTNYLKVATTDRQGSLGYNTTGTSSDYAYQGTGFSGTSASSPQIAGLCALLLSANPKLTYRDVQQVLILSARQLDPADPDTRVNGAGFPVNHTVGFGVPDAGLAVELARAWSNRPPRTTASAVNRQAVDIPDDGLRVVIRGTDVPTALQSIPAYPSDGLHPDDPTETLQLVDVGQALVPITANLTNRAALIRRGENYFVEKIGYAAAAGARFAVIYNHTNGNERIFMNGADIQFSPIPAVFIDQNSGDALHQYLASTTQATAQLRLNAVTLTLPISETLLCEHVALRARFSHPSRADVRVTLVSPAGTRSVLHHFNKDTASSLDEWTFYSTHHFFESSAGDWHVEVSDEQPDSTGRVISLELTVYGVALRDTDHDGLDDFWELAHFGALAYGPKDDPDADGQSNMREQILGKNPMVMDRPFELDLSPWDARLVRLSWPAAPDFDYELYRQVDVGAAPELLSKRRGVFPELDWFVQRVPNAQFFHVLQVPIEPPAGGD